MVSWKRIGLGVAVALSTMGVASGLGVVSRELTTREGETVAAAMPLRAGQVRHVSVSDPDRRIDLTRTTDGSWAAGPGGSSEVVALISEAQDRLFPLLAFRSLDIVTLEAEYGLDQPSARFEVHGVDGSRHSVTLGGTSFTGGGVYAQAADQPGRLFLIPRRMADDLRSLLAGERLEPPNEVARKVRELGDEQRAKQDAGYVSFWLQQALDAGVAPPAEQP